ncbi:MAG TPA: hypothetical protein VK936_11170 [Longimicrobiales bacterium]|nr:hypothetical protein [Longimicrobiales bacterium]
MDMGKPPTRRLRIFLRDFRMVEAAVHLADGQMLASYFANRKSYINLQAAEWTGTDGRVDHVVLRLDQVLWATSPDGDVQLTSASIVQRARLVEMQLDGGLMLRGGLVTSEYQRLSDYLETAGVFIPVTNAQLLRSGRPPKAVNVELGDVALNQQAIQAVWELAGLPHDVDDRPGAESVDSARDAAGTGPEGDPIG